MDPIHIVAVSNDTYAKHTAVMIHSIIENKKNSDPLHFYIVGMLSEQKRSRLIHCCKKENVTIQFFHIDEFLFADFKLFSYFKKEAYYRLLIPDLLDNNINKVIYLDSDIIVKHDISKLWSVKLSNHFLAAVQDIGYCASKKRRQILSIPLQYGYFNSGVILINLKKWREHDISKQVIEFAKHNPSKLRSIDQDALNAILYDKWLKLNAKWNYITARIRKKKFIGDPAIIHFTGKNKPWDTKRCKHPLKEEYHYYSRSLNWDQLNS